MKKFFALFLALVMTLSCTVALADTYGLGIVSSISSSKDATAEKDGAGQVDSTVCAVVVGEDGKILSCLFDMASTKVTFSAAGLITANKEAEIKTKNELGDAYNMKVASKIGMEWYQQAAALGEYCVGKTLEEVITGVNGGEDLKTSVTMGTSDFIKALEKAYAQATAK